MLYRHHRSHIIVFLFPSLFFWFLNALHVDQDRMLLLSDKFLGAFLEMFSFDSLFVSFSGPFFFFISPSVAFFRDLQIPPNNG
ncbi:hypothetical protein B0J12DRAFT_240734 [Macrophomina phaseolina]|uniref:Uncharacterized protein n=1 Tax=Macrophomina phaseolina TaxID=35725 RepID=A0ABQ8GQT5_9PEZI|nr:hypothetical protein B0J12DRAFT_240734 [Macrophomina phaseolina]